MGFHHGNSAHYVPSYNSILFELTIGQLNTAFESYNSILKEYDERKLYIFTSFIHEYTHLYQIGSSNLADIYGSLSSIFFDSELAQETNSSYYALILKYYFDEYPRYCKATSNDMFEYDEILESIEFITRVYAHARSALLNQQNNVLEIRLAIDKQLQDHTGEGLFEFNVCSNKESFHPDICSNVLTTRHILESYAYRGCNSFFLWLLENARTENRSISDGSYHHIVNECSKLYNDNQYHLYRYFVAQIHKRFSIDEDDVSKWDVEDFLFLVTCELALNIRLHYATLYASPSIEIDELFVVSRFNRILNHILTTDIYQYIKESDLVLNRNLQDQFAFKIMDMICDKLGWLRYSDSLRLVYEYHSNYEINSHVINSRRILFKSKLKGNPFPFFGKVEIPPARCFTKDVRDVDDIPTMHRTAIRIFQECLSWDICEQSKDNNKENIVESDCNYQMNLSRLFFDTYTRPYIEKIPSLIDDYNKIMDGYKHIGLKIDGLC